MITKEFNMFLHVKKSDIEGLGVFAKKDINKKSILAIPKKALFSNDYNSILLKQTAVRYCLNYFQYGNKITKEDFLNHSNNPNCMYHCGILFAIKNIKAKDELTIDYSMLVTEDEKFVNKLDSQTSFLKELTILLELFGD